MPPARPGCPALWAGPRQQHPTESTPVISDIEGTPNDIGLWGGGR